jgi:hypothetical protein
MDICIGRYESDKIRRVVQMSSPQSRRRKIYEILRNECGFTHYQTKWLITTHLGHIGNFDEILLNAAEREREYWTPHAERIAVMCMRDDPKEAGLAVFNICWPVGEEPVVSYSCITVVNRLVIQAMGFNNSQASTYRYYAGKKILNWERKYAELDWDSRMIMTYLQIKQLL